MDSRLLSMGILGFSWIFMDLLGFFSKVVFEEENRSFFLYRFFPKCFANFAIFPEEHTKCQVIFADPVSSTRLKVLGEIYKIYRLLHSSDLTISAKNRPFLISIKIKHILQFLFLTLMNFVGISRQF